MQIEIKGSSSPKKWAPLALGFRPFFLLAAWFAILFMAVSAGGFATGIWHYNYFDLSLWHAHEMLFGFAVAVVAGFLLTAVRNWTNIATPTGWQLAVLVLIWLLPRLFSSLPIPAPLFALLDTLFLPLLAAVLFRCLYLAKQPHNYNVPALLLLLGMANGGIHLDQLGLFDGISAAMLHLGVLLLVALIVLIAGRVLPFFIGRAAGIQFDAMAIVERTALPSLLLFAAINLLVPVEGVVAAAAVVVALLHALRMRQWYTPAVWSEPMLWVLYLGYVWLVAGFLIYGAALAFDLALSTALHAWTIGAITTFTLGMMARVALGHTGWPVTALPGMPLAFTLIILAAAVRVILPLLDFALLDTAVLLSATCWIIAFLIFAIRYTQLLLRPRLDGKQG